MSWTTDVDTTDLERVERPLPRVMPPIDLAPARSPFYISQVPTTALVSADAVRNFQSPQLPSYRITPPQPLTIAGSSTNATPTVAASTFNILQPPAPTIAQALSSNHVGYQFSFYQVRLPLNSNLTISTYKVYRNTTSVNTKAKVIATITHNPANAGTPIVIQDAQPNGTTQFYWVSAVSTAGVESTLTPAQSGTVSNTSALNSNSQLASSFNGVPANTTFGCLDTHTLTNTGSSPNIAIASNRNLYGPGTLTYNSGSVAPGTFGKIYVFANDPTFQGGAAPYTISLLNFNFSGDGAMPIGAIATASSTSTSGGGFDGGTTPNGAGGRGLLPA